MEVEFVFKRLISMEYMTVKGLIDTALVMKKKTNPQTFFSSKT